MNEVIDQIKTEGKEIITPSLVNSKLKTIAKKEEIKKLNKKFRKKNKPTDVLSFLLNDPNCFGEIVICPEVVKEKKEEIIRVFIHGILHLCGYDHERSEREAKEMEEKQEKYLSNIK